MGGRATNRASSAGTPATAALIRAGVEFRLASYPHDPRAASYGTEAVEALGLDPVRVFKTLLARVDGDLAVGVVPVAAQLDLKALARALGGRRATMAELADAERATGYVAGGISPVGQKRRLPTVVDSSALDHATVHVSAGRRGLEMELAPGDLVEVTRALSAHRPLSQSVVIRSLPWPTLSSDQALTPTAWSGSRFSAADGAKLPSSSTRVPLASK